MGGGGEEGRRGSWPPHGEENGYQRDCGLLFVLEKYLTQNTVRMFVRSIATSFVNGHISFKGIIL